jgi:multidrug efflux pump subunit AcrA (membrane-fusion protein)
MSLAGQGFTAENAREKLEAKVEFPAIPGRTFDLELKSFGTEASRSARTFLVTFNLYPPEGQNILPGMTCTVLLRLKRTPSANASEESLFQIPLRAVSTSDGKSSLWKLDPKALTVSQVPIELRQITGQTVNVVGATLAPGDEIVISGVRFLSEGMTVQRMQTP